MFSSMLGPCVEKLFLVDTKMNSKSFICAINPPLFGRPFMSNGAVSIEGYFETLSGAAVIQNNLPK